MALVLAGFVTVFAARMGLPKFLSLGFFTLISVSLSGLFVGTYAEHRRDIVVEAFAPDEQLPASFFTSLRNAPREFQFFLHGPALKNCQPYAWSYRTMSFYELPPNVAANVLPKIWIEKCNIQRTR
jgi:hypothetical protein